MERNLKEIRADIIKDLTISHTELRGYSPLEKFQYVQRAMDNCKAFCCAKWGMNPDNIQTGFCHGLSMNTRAVTSSLRHANVAFVDFNPLEALNRINPLQIYKTAMHEMRHVHQFLYQPENSREARSYYNTATAASSKMQSVRWAASPAEKAADKFGFGAVFSLYTRGLLKGEAQLFPIEMRRFVSSAIQRQYDHSKSTFLYPILQTYHNLQSKFGHSNKESTPIGMAKQPTAAEREAYISKQLPLSLKEIEFLAQIHPQEFSLKGSGLSDKERWESIIAIHHILEDYRVELQLAREQGFSSVAMKSLGNAISNALNGKQPVESNPNSTPATIVPGGINTPEGQGGVTPVEGLGVGGISPVVVENIPGGEGTPPTLEVSTNIISSGGQVEAEIGVVEKGGVENHSSTFASIMEHIVSTHSNSQGGAQTEVVKEDTLTQTFGSGGSSSVVDNSQNAGGADVSASSGVVSADASALTDMGAGLDMGGQE